MADMILGFAPASFAWLVWILPFAAALIIPAVGKASKHSTGYVAVGFALMSAISAALLLPVALDAGEVHDQIMWIEAIGLKAGVLADPLAVIMANVVGWISFLIMVYSTGYMKGDRDIVRFWFWMMFFIGSMQLIVLSDNLLQVFFGWEGVGLASYALISFWYRDKKKDHVGQEGRTTLGLLDYYSPTHAGMKAFIMTKIGDVMMLAGMFLIFFYAGTFGFRELMTDTAWAVTMSAEGFPDTCRRPALWRRHRQVGPVPAQRVAAGGHDRPHGSLCAHPRGNHGQGGRLPSCQVGTALLCAGSRRNPCGSVL